MKELIKLLILTILAYMVAIFIYPLMHELGHALASLILRVKILDINISVLTPSVLCEESSVYKQVIIGISGILFPFLICFFSKTKNQVLNYLFFVFKEIVLISIAISLIIIILNRVNIVINNDDITNLILLWPEGYILYFFLLFGAGSLLTIKIIIEKPWNQIKTFFD